MGVTILGLLFICEDFMNLNVTHVILHMVKYLENILLIFAIQYSCVQVCVLRVQSECVLGNQSEFTSTRAAAPCNSSSVGAAVVPCRR